MTWKPKTSSIGSRITWTMDAPMGFLASHAIIWPVTAPWDWSTMSARWKTCGAKIQSDASGMRRMSRFSEGKTHAK